ncbi:4531_t:CDS:2, partial [Scutellospora calospora]
MKSPIIIIRAALKINSIIHIDLLKSFHNLPAHILLPYGDQTIAFNHDSTRLCVSSDKGTVHIFNLDAILGNGFSNSPNNGGPYYGEKVVVNNTIPSPS